MATYWHLHPRGFQNECTLLRADTAEDAAWLEARGFDRIARSRLSRHLIASAPHDGLHWPVIVVTDPNEAHTRAGWDVFSAAIYISDITRNEAADRRMSAAWDADAKHAIREPGDVADWADEPPTGDHLTEVGHLGRAPTNEGDTPDDRS